MVCPLAILYIYIFKLPNMYKSNDLSDAHECVHQIYISNGRVAYTLCPQIPHRPIPPIVPNNALLYWDGLKSDVHFRIASNINIYIYISRNENYYNCCSRPFDSKRHNINSHTAWWPPSGKEVFLGDVVIWGKGVCFQQVWQLNKYR